jgi:hypothetical protein
VRSAFHMLWSMHRLNGFYFDPLRCAEKVSHAQLFPLFFEGVRAIYERGMTFLEGSANAKATLMTRTTSDL